MFLTMIITLRRRPAIPPDLFFEYWVNAHAGQIASRLPGIHNLRLHELSYDLGLLWPRVPGVAVELDEKDRFDGIPEPAFESEEGLQQFLAAMAPLMDDEANIFEETIAYRSFGDNSRTFVDRTDANGGSGLLRFLLFLQARDGVPVDAFRGYLADELVPGLAGSEQVLMARLHLFEPYTDDYGGLDVRGLSHAKPSEKQYQAMCELAFRDGLALGVFARSVDWTGTLERQAEHIRACHPFGVPVVHTLRRDGELTLAGLRTPLIADLIERVGAASQLEPAVVDLVLGRTS
ncbi:MAG TPA: hypothetical protein VFR38_09840 [Gaiellaceae bacterium]|nr:hypothetical protein [Gaiellaceae bacterium]